MLGFTKTKRLIEGPVEFTAEIMIDRPAADVFALVDMADARFAHAQMGATVRPVEGDRHRYTMSVEDFDDAVFQYTVLERDEGLRHTASSVMVPKLYTLEKAVEAYTIEPIADAACRVTLTTRASFDAALSDNEIASEIALMNEAVIEDLERLKVLAEDGLDAALAMEQTAIGCEKGLGDGFDFAALDRNWHAIQPRQ